MPALGGMVDGKLDAARSNVHPSIHQESPRGSALSGRCRAADPARLLLGLPILRPTPTLVGGGWQFKATGSLNAARYGHTATLLATGQVLVVGGTDDNGYLATAEVFDPSTGKWSPTGDLHDGRGFHTAALLGDGTVVVVGGMGAGGALASAELYEPVVGPLDRRGTPNVGARVHGLDRPQRW